MTATGDHPGLSAPRSLWARLGWAAAGGAVATILLGCGLLAGALQAGVQPALAEVLMVFALTAWIALAAGPLSAGADDWFGAFGRAGVLVDASIVPLAAAGVWGGGAVSWVSGLKVYLLWATLAVAVTSVVRLGRTALARGVWATAASVAAAVMLASLFWSSGALARVRGDRRAAAVQAVLAPNVAYGAARAVGYNWPEKGRIYDNITRVGQDFPAPQVAWWVPGALWGLVAAVAGAVAAIRGRKRASDATRPGGVTSRLRDA